MQLSPLGPDEVRELVTSILELDDVSPEFALQLHERTLGLPFAVEEVLHLLADRREVSTDDGHTWRNVATDNQGGGHFRASILNPQVGPGRYVSFRVSASDAGGSSIEQSIIRAYGLR